MSLCDPSSQLNEEPEVPKRTEGKGKRICKCECGGTVRGTPGDTWCDKCTPVVEVRVPTLRDGHFAAVRAGYLRPYTGEKEDQR